MRRQGVYWIATIAYDNDLDMKLLYELNCVDVGGFIVFAKGQHEVGAEGFHHWQLYVIVDKKKSLSQMKEIHPTAHWELSRSESVEDYVWKEETAVAGTRFEYGKKPFKRNAKTDWDSVWALAEKGEMSEIPAGIKIQHYFKLKAIRYDSIEPIRRPNVEVDYYWGATGTGKSHAADTKYPDAYWKISSNKWWDGYKGEDTVIIDELSTECIGITKLLTWFDKYKCRVEVKNGTVGLRATKFIITSNLSLDELLRDEKCEHKLAVKRKFKETQFLIRYNP